MDIELYYCCCFVVLIFLSIKFPNRSDRDLEEYFYRIIIYLLISGILIALSPIAILGFIILNLIKDL